MNIWSRIGQGLFTHRIAALFAAFVLLLDQITKDLAYTLWEDGGPRVLGFTLHLTRNPGLALGYLGSLPSHLRVWVILGISLSAAICIALISRAFSGSLLRGWGLALLYAGAVGNGLDRIWRGYVIDFIEPSFIGRALPSFNIADVSVAIGALLIAAVIILGARRPNAKGGDMDRLQEIDVFGDISQENERPASKATKLFKMMPGTSLVEILIVIALIGLVMGTAVVYVVPLFTKGQEGTTWTETKTLESIYELHYYDGSCPSSASELFQKNKKPEKKDPWGNEFAISCPSQHDLSIDVCSSGKDKQQGTDDDICNWKPQPK